MDKKHLEIALSKLKTPDNPKEDLEQYTITSSLAAQILNLAHISGDIEDKTVFDFGCGAGALAIGASLMGARKVVGVDIDRNVIEIAKKNVESINANVEFVCDSIKNFRRNCDTVVQNPPFGMRGQKNTDTIFLRKALECGRKVYSLHRGSYNNEETNKTRNFLTNFIESNSGKVLLIKEFKFDIPYMFKFHKKPKVSYNVDLFVIEKVD